MILIFLFFFSFRYFLVPNLYSDRNLLLRSDRLSCNLLLFLLTLAALSVFKLPTCPSMSVCGVAYPLKCASPSKLYFSEWTKARDWVFLRWRPSLLLLPLQFSFTFIQSDFVLLRLPSRLGVLRITRGKRSQDYCLLLNFNCRNSTQ